MQFFTSSPQQKSPFNKRREMEPAQIQNSSFFSLNNPWVMYGLVIPGLLGGGLYIAKRKLRDGMLKDFKENAKKGQKEDEISSSLEPADKDNLLNKLHKRDERLVRLYSESFKTGDSGDIEMSEIPEELLKRIEKMSTSNLKNDTDVKKVIEQYLDEIKQAVDMK